MIVNRLGLRYVYPLYKARPNFLIIGASKSGTTALYRYLIQHPNIIRNRTYKEIHFFDRDENYRLGIGQYLRSFPSILYKGNRLTLDATPNYLFCRKAPSRIKKTLGNIKMIVLLREPASRAYSAWSMFRSFANIPRLAHDADFRSFTRAIEEESNPVAFPQTSLRCYNYIAKGEYYSQILNYFEHFSKDSILIFESQELRDNTNFVLNRICDFVEIQHFSAAQLEAFQNQRHNVGRYEKSEQDMVTLTRLEAHFQPYNRRLFELLGKAYRW